MIVDTTAIDPRCDDLVPAPPFAHSMRGAESSGEIADGGRWQVFATAEGHALVVSVGPGKRVKRRIPKKLAGEALDTRAARVRFAKVAAPPMQKKALASLASRAKTAATAAAASKLTFADVADLWTDGELTKRYPDHCPAKVSVDGDRSRLRSLKKSVGHVPIATFTLDDAERAMANLPETCVAPGSRWQYSQTLCRVIQLAVWPLRLRPDNPIPKGFRPKIRTRAAMQWLYPDEEARLVACESIPLARRLFWGVLAREGLRDGSEATRVTWECVDLERGTLRLDKNKTKSPRTWKLDASVVRALARWKKLQYPDAEPPAGALVLVDENGAPWDGVRFAEVFRDDLRAAGITRPELYERVPGVRNPIRAHDLRATFITVKLGCGWTEAQISTKTGHQTSAMIARYRRVAQMANELDVGDFRPLDALLFADAEPVPPPVPPASPHRTKKREAAPANASPRQSERQALPRDSSRPALPVTNSLRARGAKGTFEPWLKAVRRLPTTATRGASIPGIAMRTSRRHLRRAARRSPRSTTSRGSRCPTRWSSSAICGSPSATSRC